MRTKFKDFAPIPQISETDKTKKTESLADSKKRLIFAPVKNEKVP
jgi:hypothetical protein